METLKKGPGWSREVTCTGKGNGGGGCGAVLRIREGDIFKTESYHYDGSSESYLTIECPECGKFTDIENVPSQIKILSKSEYYNQKKRRG